MRFTGTITATDAQVRRVRLKTLGASDVVVQTRALVSNNSGSKLSWASVGVTARVSSIGNANFDAYSCEVDLTNRRLTLIAWDNAADTGIAATPINSVTLAASYTLRIEVKGSALRCSLVGGPSVTGTSSKWASGTAGVVTFRTAACFDYLLVMRAP